MPGVPIQRPWGAAATYACWRAGTGPAMTRYWESGAESAMLYSIASAPGASGRGGWQELDVQRAAAGAALPDDGPGTGPVEVDTRGDRSGLGHFAPSQGLRLERGAGGPEHAEGATGV